MFINKCLAIFCNDMHVVKLRELDTGPDNDIIEGMPCHGDMVILKLSLQKSFYFQNIKPRRLEYRLKHIFLRPETRFKCIKELRLFFSFGPIASCGHRYPLACGWCAGNLNWPIRIQQVGKNSLFSGQCKLTKVDRNGIEIKQPFLLESALNIHLRGFTFHIANGEKYETSCVSKLLLIVVRRAWPFILNKMCFSSSN